MEQQLSLRAALVVLFFTLTTAGMFTLGLTEWGIGFTILIIGGIIVYFRLPNPR